MAKICVMGQDISIATLRSRVSALVEQESVLLTQAFELSRGGGDRRGVDALFAQVQAMQVERNSLRKQIGQVLGTQRLHEAAEVWLAWYDYRRVVGGDPVRVHVTQGPLGLQALLPGQRDRCGSNRSRGLRWPAGAGDGPPAAEREAVAQNARTPARQRKPKP
jgi:hypothetical protein